MNIKDIPFSYFGSYMSLVEEEGRFFVRSLHGKSKANMNSLQLHFNINQKKENFKAHLNFYDLVLTSQDSRIEMVFVDDNRLLVHTQIKDLSIEIDALPYFNFEYSYYFPAQPRPYIIVNSYKNLTKYLIYPQKGNIKLEQTVSISSIGSMDSTENCSKIHLEPDEDGVLEFIIQDIPTNMALPSDSIFDINEIRRDRINEFEDFYKAFSIKSEQYQSDARLASYIIWSNTVAPQGNLKHYGIFASNHNFPGVWSWDHAFASLALSSTHPTLAYSNMVCVLEHQDELGQVPGSVSDSTIRWNFSKPPVHGYFFLKMLESQIFSDVELRQIATWIEKQTQFYLSYKDFNKDGICEYHHGNDSGQDNSTVFKSLDLVDSPDLSAFLIKNYDCLVEVYKRLNNKKKSEHFSEKAENLTRKVLDYFIHDNLPVARYSVSQKMVETNSLIPYFLLLISDRLPVNIRQSMVKELKEKYITEWGVATEAIDSSEYMDDAYWRGPIWGPSSLLIIDVLEKCGEQELANQLKQNFLELCHNSAFNENYDAKSGKGLRDTGFTWTASTFLDFLRQLEML